MATFLIETYLSRTRAADLEAARSSLRAVAADARGDARANVPPVRYIRSFYVPEDEMAFHVVEASSIAAAMAVSQRAGLSPERIVEAEAPSG